ncbi:MAG: hypothetical protein RQ753_01965 [Desulfurivibrionaceae bacterium]|nr:hypothetical protein [Desulfobulbales bacterium]MDT8334442.1 hypothetical protein [Desulfurivibrionaceae bacterium]
MKIDITKAPPDEIFKDRGKYLWISLVLLSLALCGVLLIVYGIVSAGPASETLEKVALGLLIGPAVFFTYFGVKLRAYKRLGPQEKEELIVMGSKYPAIATYVKLVSAQGRQPIFAEYEAVKEWAENEVHRRQSG